MAPSCNIPGRGQEERWAPVFSSLFLFLLNSGRCGGSGGVVELLASSDLL